MRKWKNFLVSEARIFFNIKAILINMSEFSHFVCRTMKMKITQRMTTILKIVCACNSFISQASIEIYEKFFKHSPIKLN